MPDETLVSLQIENHYELYGDQTTTIENALVPVPPHGADEDALHDWAMDHLYGYTGVGHEHGDSWYFVRVTASEEPSLVGKTFEFGL